MDNQIEILIGEDIKPLPGFDADSYESAVHAARGAYFALQEHVVANGGHPDDVWIKAPDEAEGHGYGVKGWWVCWEGGDPYMWACQFVQGPWGYCETYWGFDLIFYDEPRPEVA